MLESVYLCEACKNKEICRAYEYDRVKIVACKRYQRSVAEETVPIIHAPLLVEATSPRLFRRG